MNLVVTRHTEERDLGSKSEVIFHIHCRLELTADERAQLDKYVLLRDPISMPRLLGLQRPADSRLPFGGPSRFYLLDLVEGGQSWSSRVLYNAFTVIPDALTDYAQAILRALKARESWGSPNEQIIAIQLEEDVS
jgi:hypothetical protein